MKHDTKDTLFLLAVDDFAIKYTLLDNARHLLNALKTKYTISEYFKAQLYIGITLKWDCSKRTVDLSMSGYVYAALLRFRHLKRRKHNSPHPHAQPKCGAKFQYATPANNSPILSDKRLKYIQQVVVVFLYYSIAINNTILVGLGYIAAKQSVATANTNACVDHLLDYLSSNPNATIHYHTSVMVLFIDINASYLSVAKAHSRAIGFYFLSNPKPNTITFTEYTPLLNGFSMFCSKFFEISWLKQLKPNTVPSSSMANPPCPCKQPYPKWVIPNHPSPPSGLSFFQPQCHHPLPYQCNGALH